jgi:ABC-type glycerol-3-phosphate transport system permease component
MKLLLYALLVVTCAAFLLPLAWTVISSIKPEAQIVSYPPRWIPAHATLQNYSRVLERFNFLGWMINSIIVASLATIIVVIIDAMAAYALARLRFPGRRLLLAIIVSMLLVPVQAYVVPMFILFSGLRLVNTRAALILPLLALVTGVYLLARFFEGIPREMEEAARIDGWNDAQIFLSLMLPLSKPILSSVAILSFNMAWNDFLWPVIVVSADRIKTLPVGLAQFMGAQGGGAGSAPEYGLSLASACLAVVPTVVVFLAFQKYFVQGISTTGLKG